MGDNETLERNMLTEMNKSTTSEFQSKYKINPQTLLQLTTNISDSLIEPLIEGYYDKTNDFGNITNSKRKKKTKKKKKQKSKTPKSLSPKNHKNKIKEHQRAQTAIPNSTTATTPKTSKSPKKIKPKSKSAKI